MLKSNAINTYLKNQASLDLLRFITCGSVDDGKSTLIGRMLYESQMIFDDQVASLKNDSKKYFFLETQKNYFLISQVSTPKFNYLCVFSSPVVVSVSSEQPAQAVSHDLKTRVCALS